MRKKSKSKCKQQPGGSSVKPSTTLSSSSDSSDEYVEYSSVSSIISEDDDHQLKSKAVKHKQPIEKFCSNEVCIKPSDSTMIKCDKCLLFFHIECVNMNKCFYDFYIKNKHVGNFWQCESCKIDTPPKTKPLDKIRNKLNELEKMLQMVNESTNARLNNLECNSIHKTEGIKENATKKSHTPRVQNPIQHQIVVTPDDDKSFTPSTFADKVKETLSEVPVKKIAVTKSGQGVLQFPDVKTRDVAMSALKNFNVKSEDKNFRSLMPRIQVFDLNNENYPENSVSIKEKLKLSIINKNPELKKITGEKKCFDILLIKPDTKRPGFSTAIIKVDPDVLNIVKAQNFRLFIDFSSCRVDLNLVPMQCFTCQGFHHKSNSPFCKHTGTNKKACLYCGDNHSSKECPNKKDKQLYKCVNCSNAGLKNICHSSTDKRCPMYQKQVELLRNKTIGLEDFSKN